MLACIWLAPRAGARWQRVTCWLPCPRSGAEDGGAGRRAAASPPPPTTRRAQCASGHAAAVVRRDPCPLARPASLPRESVACAGGQCAVVAVARSLLTVMGRRREWRAVCASHQYCTGGGVAAVDAWVCRPQAPRAGGASCSRVCDSVDRRCRGRAAALSVHVSLFISYSYTWTAARLKRALQY